MKKFTILTAALALFGFGLPATAADSLGDAVVTNFEGGKYLDEWTTVFNVEWQDAQGLPLVLTLAENPEVTVTLNDVDYKVPVEPGSANSGGWDPGPGWGPLAQDDATNPDEEDDDDADDEDEVEITYIIFNIEDALTKAAEAAKLESYIGNVVITIPADLVTSDGLSNGEQVLNYVRANAIAKESIDPEEDFNQTFTPSALSSVTVTFPDKLTLIGGTIQVNYEPSDITGKVDGNNLILDLSTLEDGYQSVMIPLGYVQVGDNEFDINSAFSIDYNVFDGLPSVEMLMGPGEYVAAGYMPNIELTWDYTNITATEDPGLTATLTLATGPVDEWGEPTNEDITIPAKSFHLAYIEKPSEEEGGPSNDPTKYTRADEELTNVVLIDLNEYIPASYTGYVELVIPEGIVEDSNKKVNAKYTIQFTVYKYAEVDASIEIEDNLINIEWEGYTVSDPTIPMFIVDSEGERTDLTMEGQDLFGNPTEGEVSKITDPDSDYSWIAYGFQINLSGLKLADGNYILGIPGESILLETEVDDATVTFLNMEQTFNFTVKDGMISETQEPTVGVDKLEVEELNGPVYNVNGIRVNSDVNAFPNGLYIINGKKVLIRK